MLPTLPAPETFKKALGEASDSVADAVSTIAANGAKVATSSIGLAASGVKAATSFVESMYDSSCVPAPTFHFGKPITECAAEDVAGYEAPIPSILPWLREWFMEANGLAQKGIFRTSARAVLVKRFKKILSSEPLLSQVRVDPAIKNDAPLFASLIKLWLRELPTGLLNSLDPSRLQLLGASDIQQTISSMPVQDRAVLLWVLDLFAMVVRAEERTLMTRKAAAILLGPNLFRMQPDSDMGVYLMQIKVVTTFIESALLWRMGSVF